MGLNNENAFARPWISFDIETCPMPGCEAYLTDAMEAPSNYKDPAKIAAFIAEKRAAQIKDAGLDLDLCEIAAIAISANDFTVVQHGGKWDERKMLEWFWRETRDRVLVGYHCISFDLPILLRRSLYLNIIAPPIQVDKYRHEGVIDVAEVLSYNFRMTWRSQAFYSKRFGLPYDDSVKGEDIARLVAAGEWDKVGAHCAEDARATAALAQRIGLIYAPAATPV